MSVLETPLQQQIDDLQAQSATRMPPDVLATLRHDRELLAQTGIASQALGVGQPAPDFTLPDATGNQVTLSRLLAAGPVVLTFYRGDWCPYCNLQLRAYQQALPQMQALGATLVAVSPQTPDNTLTTVEKRELTFYVLSDAGNQVARRYGLVYTLSAQLRSLYAELMGLDLASYNGDDTGELPMAGTFVIGREGNVHLAFVDADYTRRLEPATIIASLRELQ
jgi:peroxiredoxin